MTSATQSSRGQNLKAYSLSVTQTAYLKTKLEAYRMKRKRKDDRKGRGLVVKEACRRLKEDWEAMTELEMSPELEKRMKRAVNKWFEENIKYERGPTKKPWGMRWTARLVFQYERSRAIGFLAKLMAQSPAPELPDLRELLDDEDEVIPPEAIRPEQADYVPSGPDEDEDEESIGLSTQGGNEDEGGEEEEEEEEVEEEEEEDQGEEERVGDDEEEQDEDEALLTRAKMLSDQLDPSVKPFAKYQTATSLLFNALTPDEVAYYRNKARTWLAMGPPLAERRRVAERFLRSRIFDFIVGLMNDMNARVYLLVGFEKMDGSRRSFDVEFNKELRGCEKSFKETNPAECATLKGRWDVWVEEAFNAQEGADPNAAMDSSSASKGRPLWTLELDEHGRPLLPPWSSKGSLQPAVWLRHVLRSYLTRYYVLASGSDPLPSVFPLGKQRPSVPWTPMGKEYRRYVDEEYFPENVPFRDPWDIDSLPLRILYQHLWKRQQDPNITTPFLWKAVLERTKGGATRPKAANFPRQMGTYVPPPSTEGRRKGQYVEVDTDEGSVSDDSEDDLRDLNPQPIRVAPSPSPDPEDLQEITFNRPLSSSPVPEDMQGIDLEPIVVPRRPPSSSPEMEGTRSMSSSPIREDIRGISAEPTVTSSRSPSSSPEPDVLSMIIQTSAPTISPRPPRSPPRSPSHSRSPSGSHSRSRSAEPTVTPSRSPSSSPEPDVLSMIIQTSAPTISPRPPRSPPRSPSHSRSQSGSHSRSRSSSPEQDELTQIAPPRSSIRSREPEDLGEGSQRVASTNRRPPSSKRMLEGLAVLSVGELDTPRQTRKRVREEENDALPQAKKGSTGGNSGSRGKRGGGSKSTSRVRTRGRNK
ncbi:hypothetical protein CC1G_13090 [Coprinopsis cinerea okayama7|uniref:Uncharacterized protein n=1 Tax=Coprinopsis cinerea (strain Okayama-7 / 130 / ATCC MYA-4618 / FGSC 9003) TaxID=240176 RepID=A8NZ96_COPC7|nr:hypothetical protein CC1G_13090 [Coprinopsis cinerea okayama7\|eukprot:XP_001837635.2 hypothetical protein CC1G_13090 [Coprinopsis cinerea okayama7\